MRPPAITMSASITAESVATVAPEITVRCSLAVIGSRYRIAAAAAIRRRARGLPTGARREGQWLKEAERVLKR
jgi:hypothetical protein